MHNLALGAKSLSEGWAHAREQYWIARHYRRLSHERDAAFTRYSRQPMRALHIGAQGIFLENWFNTDLDPRGDRRYYLDATKPFPFPDASFDFIFSEHMIEHIPFADGLNMLRECRRVLKPSGVVRTATPNLKKVLSLMLNHDPDVQRYLKWAVKEFKLPNEPYPEAPMVVNNFFHAWGHKFLYDPDTFRAALSQAGFHKIVQQKPRESEHPELRGLERHGDVVGDFANEFETMVFEGSAP